MPMTLPDDIVAKVGSDFPTSADREFVLQALANLGVEERDRVARCVLFCAAGDMVEFRAMLTMAQLDYRDAIMNAEYEPSPLKRVRNFIEPFAT